MKNNAALIEELLDFARHEENIRLVVLNGSLVNPDFTPDEYQDIDVSIFVRDLQPYIRNYSTPAAFGDLAILQTPDDWGEPRPNVFRQFAYLAQYKDGSRIDFTFQPVTTAYLIYEDSLSKVVLDKDDLIPELPEPNDSSYFPTRPTPNLYADCCNEFWWLMPYIAKGIARGKPAYAQAHLSLARQQLYQMLIWHFGFHTDFKQNTGKHGRRLAEVIGEDSWQRFLDTYTSCETTSMVSSCHSAMDLFEETSREVAKEFGYTFESVQVSNVRRFLPSRFPGIFSP
ncbi:MAG TPA: aminoglycoside 6-adenylyltransferase [Bellilinea sp.]|nr:aminoglycoside 6-adenylyltransferase [Bellilinea sp.]